MLCSTQLPPLELLCDVNSFLIALRTSGYTYSSITLVGYTAAMQALHHARSCTAARICSTRCTSSFRVARIAPVRPTAHPRASSKCRATPEASKPEEVWPVHLRPSAGVNTAVQCLIPTLASSSPSNPCMTVCVNMPSAAPSQVSKAEEEFEGLLPEEDYEVRLMHVA